MYKEAVSRMTENWKNWEGQVVDGRFPLRQYLGGRTRTAVFSTTVEGDSSRKQAIRIALADPQESQVLLDNWMQASKLSHPSLLRIFHLGRGRLGSIDLVYMVMEFADEDLSQVLPHRALSATEIHEVLEATLDVLAYLHGKGFVHGRVKPANILAVNNQMKISSDGLFRIGERRTAKLAASPYDAPETYREAMRPAADFWSLGVTIVESLTQILPRWDRSNQMEPSLQKLPAPYPEITRHCLLVDPRMRWGAEEIRERLRQAASPPSQQEDAGAKPLPSGRRVPVTAVAVVLLVLALFGIAKFFHRPRAENPAVQQHVQATSQQITPASSEPATSQDNVASRGSVPPSPPANLEGKDAGEAHSAPVPLRNSNPNPRFTAPAEVPGVVKKVVPSVPQSARNTIQGTIRVAVKVKADDSGKVVNTELASAGPSKYFAGLATKAAQQWMFSSASEGLAPREWLLHFEFRQKETAVRPEPIH